MPIDIDAEVVANTRLSEDYNVVALTAPGIASLAQPGQFVMIKPARGIDPLLRRPFSIFEILRDGQGAATGVSLLNKRIGVGTGMLYEARPGSRLAVLGPLGRPFEPIDPPAEAWMVAGGVGLGPFVTLAEALRARGTRTRLFYGARRASELVYVDRFERLGVESVIATEDGGRGAHGFITVPLAAELDAAPASPALRIYVCGPTPMMRAVAEIAQLRNRPCDVSLEQVMGCGLGGCYSCVVLTKTPAGPNHFVRSCVDGPVFDATRIVWDALTH
jgi:dihydroorotate dehydrogenase electron transfer subunit